MISHVHAVVDDLARAFLIGLPAHGRSSEGAPGLRPHFHDNHHGACSRDPAGNKLCICCHHPVPT